MAKKIKAYIKLQIKGGQATPAPPVGPALGQHGVPIPQFTAQFNDRTKDKMGTILPVVITVYEDKSFDFVVKEPPAGVLVKNKLGLASGSKIPQKDKVGHLTFAQLKEIAEQKMVDLNAKDIAGAMKIIDGTARATGVTTDIHGMSKADVAAKL
ncbi:50S ribosomal protein L11 [Candidatus Gracilibacteria bacterium]|nr:50S ribosomal protein L11 [Candidatus Gracilibacteria bacterium]